MASVNKVIIVGNLGADPDVKTFDNGGRVANVSVATSERWTDKQTGEPREITEWHRVVFNDRLADVVAQYLRKGSQIYVEGSLRTRKWTDQQGVERYTTEIRANNMQMLGSRSQNSYDNGAYQNQGQFQNQPYQHQGYQNQHQGYQNQGYGNQGYQNQPMHGYQQNPNFDQHYGQAEPAMQGNQAPQTRATMPNNQAQANLPPSGNAFGSPNVSHSQAPASIPPANASLVEQPAVKQVLDEDMPF